MYLKVLDDRITLGGKYRLCVVYNLMSHAVITFSVVLHDVLYTCTIFHVVSNYKPHKCDKHCPSYLLLYHILVKRGS